MAQHSFLIVYIVCFVLLFPYCVYVCLSISVMGLEPAIEIKFQVESQAYNYCSLAYNAC